VITEPSLVQPGFNAELNDAILNRERFSYSYWRRLALDNFGSRMFCCCRMQP